MRMLVLARPTMAPARVINDCIGGYSDPKLVARLRAIETTLISAANLYDSLAQSKALHTIPRTAAIKGLSKTELEDITPTK
jgi:hypothetical protein